MLVLGVALLLASAKTHGRQVRLRREAEGFMAVDFRHDNGPWVEELWRRDRVGFWSLCAALGAAAVLYLLASEADLVWNVGLSPIPNGLVLLAWAFSASFLGMGIHWWVDLARCGRPVPPGAHRGTVAWLALDLALVGAQAILLA